jgi:hypothetical protein
MRIAARAHNRYMLWFVFFENVLFSLILIKARLWSCWVARHMVYSADVVQMAFLDNMGMCCVLLCRVVSCCVVLCEKQNLNEPANNDARLADNAD